MTDTKIKKIHTFREYSWVSSDKCIHLHNHPTIKKQIIFFNPMFLGVLLSQPWPSPSQPKATTDLPSSPKNLFSLF